MFSGRFSNTVGVQQCTLQHKPAKAVNNPDDRVPQALVVPSERGEVVGHGLSMLMEKILTGMLVFVGKDVRIVTVDDDIGESTLFLQCLCQ